LLGLGTVPVTKLKTVSGNFNTKRGARVQISPP